MIHTLHLPASDKENALSLSCFINRDDSDVLIGRCELAFAYQAKHITGDCTLPFVTSYMMVRTALHTYGDIC